MISGVAEQQWTIELKAAASLLQNFLLRSFAALTLLSLNILSQKSYDSFFKSPQFQFETQVARNNDVINVFYG